MGGPSPFTLRNPAVEALRRESTGPPRAGVAPAPRRPLAAAVGVTRPRLYSAP